MIWLEIGGVKIKYLLRILIAIFFKNQKNNKYFNLKYWFFQRVLLVNRKVYWPVNPNSFIGNINNIKIGISTVPGYSPGCYIQGMGKTILGDYVYIGPNVALISANHDKYDLRKHIIKEVRIDSYSWIGYGAVVLPGVHLGEFTVVGANAVVTKSFPEGHCVLAGNPAKIVKILDKEKCVRYFDEVEYIGYKKVKAKRSFK